MILRKIIHTILILALLLIGLIIFLLFSNTGLKLALLFLNTQTNNRLQYSHVSGYLAGPIHFENLRYTSDRLTLVAKQFRTRVSFDTTHWGLIYLNDIQASLLDGSIKGAAEITLLPTLTWQLQLQAKQLNLAALHAAAHSNINFDITINGNKQDNNLTNHIKLQQISGHYRNQPLQGFAILDSINHKIIRLNSQVKLDQAYLKVDGHKMDHWHINWQIHLPDLSVIEPSWDGRVYSEGVIQGSHDAPQIVTTLSASKVQTEHFSVAQLHAKIHLNFASNANSTVNVSAHKLKLSYAAIDNITINGSGNQQQIININLTQQQQQLHTSIMGQWQNGLWRGVIQQFTISGKSHNWHLAKATPIIINDTQFNLQAFCLRNANSQICLNAAWFSQQNWHLLFDSHHFSLDNVADFFPRHFNMSNVLNGQLHMQSKQGNVTAHVDLKLSPGELSYPILDQIQRIPIQGGFVHANISPKKGAQANFKFTFESGEQLLGTVALPHYKGKNLPQSTQAIRGNLQLSVHHLRILPLLVPQLRAPTGNLLANVALQGTLKQPDYNGNIALTNASADIPMLGITLKNVNANIALKNRQHINLQANLQSGLGRMNIVGTGVWQPQRFSLTAKVTGQAVLVADLDQVNITASPDLALTLDNQNLTLSGNVTVPNAKINPDSFNNDVTTADDIVLVRHGLPLAKSMRMKLFTKINLSLGDNVYLDYKGIHAQLTGNLAINDSPDTLATAVGVLHTTSGKYTAYGQNLTITQGKLIFTGGPITNPGLDIKASKTFNHLATKPTLSSSNFSNNDLFLNQTSNVVLGVSVENTLRKPVITFFSEPAGLSQADILSYLLTGGPSSMATKQDQQNITTAISALNATSSGFRSVTNQVRSALGLSELGLSSGAEYDGNQDDLVQGTSVVLGKYLTPRLYVNYKIGVLNSFNTFQMSYKLNQHWSLQAQTNHEGSGVDLFYTIAR